MLVLTRKPHESIMIGDDIEVSVLSVVGEKVRVGIRAPRDVPVYRMEVYLEIQREQAAGDRPQNRASGQAGSGASGRPERDGVSVDAS